MTTLFLLSDLMLEEAPNGKPVLTAYPDPRSGGAPWTIGYGYTGREVHPGLVWTPAQCQAALRADVGTVTAGLTTAIPWWLHLDDPRQDVLVDMGFNLGIHGLLGFGSFLGFVRAGKYADAALDLRGTDWYDEVGHRAQRLVSQMASGIHTPLA